MSSSVLREVSCEVDRPRRGEVWWVNDCPCPWDRSFFKSRPFVVIGGDGGDSHGSMLVGLPVTTWRRPKRYPTEVFLCAPDGGVYTNSVIQANLILSLPKSEFSRRLGVLPVGILAEVESILSVYLSLGRG